MARKLTVVVLAAILLLAIFWISREDAQVPGAALVTAAPGPAARPQPLAEVDAPAARRAGIFRGCNRTDDADELKRLEAEWEQQQEQMIRVLDVSTTAEHLLVAALASWRKRPEEALQLLDKAVAIDPRNALVASQLLELCNTIESCNRARPGLERHLIATDNANGMAWVQVARSRLKRLDERGALTALREAYAAATIDEYFVDYVLLFDRGLAASTNLDPFDRMIAAFGHAAAVLTSAYLVTQDCQERAQESAEWRDACLRLGERFEHDGRTLLTASIGTSLQAMMYEFGGDTRSQEDAVRRRQELRNQWLSLAGRAARAEDLRDATMQRKYLETFAASGELAAMQYLADEVESRLPDATQTACETP